MTKTLIKRLIPSEFQSDRCAARYRYVESRNQLMSITLFLRSSSKSFDTHGKSPRTAGTVRLREYRVAIINN